MDKVKERREMIQKVNTKDMESDEYYMPVSSITTTTSRGVH